MRANRKTYVMYPTQMWYVYAVRMEENGKVCCFFFFAWNDRISAARCLFVVDEYFMADWRAIPRLHTLNPIKYLFGVDYLFNNFILLIAKMNARLHKLIFNTETAIARTNKRLTNRRPLSTIHRAPYPRHTNDVFYCNQIMIKIHIQIQYVRCTKMIDCD